LFQNGWRERLDKHGHLFIDRDSTIFPLILNYLRDSSIPLPRDEYYLERILREARFFKLHNLCADVEKKIDQLTHRKSAALPRINENIGEVSPSSIRSETTFDAEKKSPGTPRCSLDGSFSETPLVPTRRRGKGKKPDSISLPRNFT
ncbi:K+ channel tetramerization domain protein, partial [Ancylostoma caninum]